MYIPPCDEEVSYTHEINYTGIHYYHVLLFRELLCLARLMKILVLLVTA